MRKRIRVLVVDDSAVYRQDIASGLAAAPDIEAAATAADPFEARDRILEHHPDVMVCDVHMPKMNGIPTNCGAPRPAERHPSFGLNVFLTRRPTRGKGWS